MPYLKHTFPYRVVGSSQFVRPFIPLTLKHHEKTVRTLALVDSGADFCMFDGELASLLGLDVRTLEHITLGGIAGEARGYVAHLQIGVEDAFTPVPVVFSFDFSPDDFGGLAGQIGFFDTYIVEFDRTIKRITLSDRRIRVKG